MGGDDSTGTARLEAGELRAVFSTPLWAPNLIGKVVPLPGMEMESRWEAVPRSCGRNSDAGTGP